MALSLSNAFLLLASLLLCISSATIAQTSFRPKALLLPVSKDASTSQYTTQLKQRTPLANARLTVHLGGQTLWVNCENNFKSSTYKPSRCNSAQCSLANADSCSGENVCGHAVDNPIIKTATNGDIGQDVLSLQSTYGSNPGRVVRIPNFIFTCGANLLVKGLAKGVTGMAGLGRSKVGLPTQLAAAFSFKRKFAVCLASSTSENGFIIFGDGPYVIRPDIDVSKALTYTPLFINPVSTASAFSSGEKSVEYFIGVKSIKVNSKAIKVNTTLLSIDSQGVGGTKISTVDPYTVLENSIYKAVVSAFVSGLPNGRRVTPVAPFDVCFNSSDIQTTRVGYAVPGIEFVLQNENVKFSVTGANSMVRAKDGVLCLGFVNGGVNPRTSIVIGGYQLENNLLQFDLAANRLGISPPLILQYRTVCSNFNFTSV